MNTEQNTNEVELQKFLHIESLEYISLQLKAYTQTLDTLQSQFEVQKIGEEVISAFVTLQHGINNIRSEIDVKISDIVMN